MSTYKRALVSARSTYRGFGWVYSEFISRQARKQIRRSLVCLIMAVGCYSAIPYTVQKIIDATVAHNTGQALWWLGSSFLLGTMASVFGLLQDHFREHAWNNNFYNVHTTLVHKMFRRSTEEIVSDQSEISAEQIESLKDRIQNILYMVLFEASIVLLTILSITVFMFLVDVLAGFVLVLLTLFNVGWFFYFNAKIDQKLMSIDARFRRAVRRLIEKLHMAMSIKSGGVEQKIEHQVGEELTEPLAADLDIWAYWFLYVDALRRLVNSLVPPLLLLYGLTVGSWTVGELSAGATWTYAVAQQYGFIGHLMRHMTSQVARVKAARLALSKAPPFDYDEGIIYQRRKDYAHNLP